MNQSFRFVRASSLFPHPLGPTSISNHIHHCMLLGPRYSNSNRDIGSECPSGRIGQQQSTSQPAARIDLSHRGVKKESVNSFDIQRPHSFLCKYTSVMPFSHHSHSGQFCPGHAKDSLEEVIQLAIAKKFQVFCLTEHMPRGKEDFYPEEVLRQTVYVNAHS